MKRTTYIGVMLGLCVTTIALCLVLAMPGVTHTSFENMAQHDPVPWLCIQPQLQTYTLPSTRAMLAPTRVTYATSTTTTAVHARSWELSYPEQDRDDHPVGNWDLDTELVFMCTRAVTTRSQQVFGLLRHNRLSTPIAIPGALVITDLAQWAEDHIAVATRAEDTRQRVTVFRVSDADMVQVWSLELNTAARVVLSRQSPGFTLFETNITYQLGDAAYRRYPTVISKVLWHTPIVDSVTFDAGIVVAMGWVNNSAWHLVRYPDFQMREWSRKRGETWRMWRVSASGLVLASSTRAWLVQADSLHSVFSWPLGSALQSVMVAHGHLWYTTVNSNTLCRL